MITYWHTFRSYLGACTRSARDIGGASAAGVDAHGAAPAGNERVGCKLPATLHAPGSDAPKRRSWFARMAMSLNDPQWGRRGGNQGPPDLDEMLAQLQSEDCGSVRTQAAAAASARRPAAWRARRRRRSACSARVSCGWRAASTSSTRQRGVVLRFGKYVEETQPGPRWHLPYPIESAEVVNLSQVRTVEIGYAQRRQEQGAEGIADAHRRREHHRHAVRRAVRVERRQGLPLQRAIAGRKS